MQEHYKSNYPQGANIILSGVAKRDNYYGGYTIERQEATVITADFEQKDVIHNARIVPIYTISENLNLKTLRGWFKTIPFLLYSVLVFHIHYQKEVLL